MCFIINTLYFSVSMPDSVPLEKIKCKRHQMGVSCILYRTAEKDIMRWLPALNLLGMDTLPFDTKHTVCQRLFAIRFA